ncbi:MAG: hypothetical protein LBL39_06355, partial [Planctomycetaceae bacterium]|nr:hypothetical protein [Planctomycetaceae bacterium]
TIRFLRESPIISVARTDSGIFRDCSQLRRKIQDRVQVVAKNRSKHLSLRNLTTNRTLCN